jgi:hypothetical protein
MQHLAHRVSRLVRGLRVHVRDDRLVRMRSYERWKAYRKLSAVKYSGWCALKSPV